MRNKYAVAVTFPIPSITIPLAGSRLTERVSPTGIVIHVVGAKSIGPTRLYRLLEEVGKDAHISTHEAWSGKGPNNLWEMEVVFRPVKR